MIMKYNRQKLRSMNAIMNCQHRVITVLICLAGLSSSTVTLASIPVWKLTPLTATTISVSTIETATIQYLVTNQSNRSHTLSLNSTIPGVTQNASSGYCSNPFTLGSQQSCTLTLIVQGASLQSNIVGGPVVCEQGNILQCYQPSAADSLNITSFAPLSVSVSNLALSVKNTGFNSQLTGTPRTITVTNTDTMNMAEDLSIEYPTWPVGTAASSTCGSVLNAGASCTITVTPGAIATSNCNAGEGSAPTPGIITISASNIVASATTDVEVLSYGCLYQGGYIYSIDDTTAANTSIGGTIVSISNNSSSEIWYNGTFATTGAQSLTDGATNTTTIISAQGSGNYAADLCANYTIDSSGNSPCLTGTCYQNWYLPAICQLGGFNPSQGLDANCPAGTPSLSTNLPRLVGCTDSTACLFGYYWSSTESSGVDPSYPSSNYAWYEYFYSSGTVPPDFQSYDSKSSNTSAVRCSRALT